MINVNAIMMSYDEFEGLVGKVSDGHAGIGFEANNWFFISDDEYDTGDIYKDLAKHLGLEQISIYTDFTHEEYEVVILYK